MIAEPLRSLSLNDAQRRLVSDNLGLVAVHLRRQAAALRVPWVQEQRDDFFQEGCMGLIRAALAFRHERGIPFAAFALARIHQAVSRALKRTLRERHIPIRRAAQAPGSENDDPQGIMTHEPMLPKVRSLSVAAAARMVDQRRCRPRRRRDDTIARRLRHKYEGAVQDARRLLARRNSPRADRHHLVDTLIDERWMIPEEDARTALREIARRTKSSFARVVQCDRSLHQAVRQSLSLDPEFGELRRCARASPRGMEAAVNPPMERRLAQAGARAFLRTFRHANATERARLLQDWLSVSEVDIESLLNRSLLRLPPAARERLLHNAWTRTRAVEMQVGQRRVPAGEGASVNRPDSESARAGPGAPLRLPGPAAGAE